MKTNSRYSFSGIKRPKKASLAKIYVYVNAAKTEREYFEGLNKYCLDKKIKGFALIPLAGFTASTMVKTIAERREFQKGVRDPGDEFFAVFDIDELKTSRPKGGMRSTLDTIISGAIESGEKKGIKCYYSNPCFEIWVLLHYRKLKPSEEQLDQSGILRLVENEWRKHHSEEYKKGIPLRRFMYMMSGTNFSNACSFADALARKSVLVRSEPVNIFGKPYTNVMDLVRKILYQDTERH